MEPVAATHEALVDGMVVHAYAGAYRWRFCVIDPATDQIRAITSHRYDTPRDALDAGIAWVKHPYPTG